MIDSLIQNMSVSKHYVQFQNSSGLNFVKGGGKPLHIIVKTLSGGQDPQSFGLYPQFQKLFFSCDSSSRSPPVRA